MRRRRSGWSSWCARRWPWAEVAVADGEAERGQRVQRLFAALDGVKEFAVAGRLNREELHAR